MYQRTEEAYATVKTSMYTIYFNMSVVRRLLWFLLIFHGYTVAQLPSDYYHKKEEQVREMAAEILKLHEARCDWVDSCSSANCSRHCSSSADGCYSGPVNYAMSYVRIPPSPTSNTSEIPDEIMCSTICMTRNFTITMKALASQNEDTNDVDEFFFFGSVDGIDRFYRGEENDNQGNDIKCKNFDPRARTWYNGAISLPTYLIVLIDNSTFSNDEVNSQSMSTALDGSKFIVKELIKTPSTDDILDVIVFNQTTAIALSTSPVRVQDNTQLEEFQDGRKNLIDLINRIPKPPTSQVEYYGDGFGQAFSTALNRSDGIKGTLNTVILVFTNGRFASNLQLVDRQGISAMLSSNFTKLFIYSFEISSNLQALAKESDGYYETIVDYFGNPLYQIRSFFDFMALARNASANEPHWTKFFKDFEGRGNITTVSYQALSQEGHLVGVVAIDIIFKSEQGKGPPNAGYRPTKLNDSIFLHTEVKPMNITCNNCNGKEAICERCNPESHKWRVIAATVGPLVLLALIISVAWWVWRRKRSGIPKPASTESWPYE